MDRGRPTALNFWRARKPVDLPRGCHQGNALEPTESDWPNTQSYRCKLHTLRATPRRYSLLGLRLSANLQADLGKVKQQMQHELKHLTEILQFASFVRCLDMSFEHHQTQQRCTGDTTLETSNHQQGPQPTSPCAKTCSYMLIPSCAKM